MAQFEAPSGAIRTAAVPQRKHGDGKCIDMRHAATRELFGYWNRLRGNRHAPRRDEVEPSDIRQLLSDTFILEVSGTLKTVSYRLAGTKICAIFGRELKGYGYLGHWSEHDSFDIARVLARVYRDFEPMLVVMRGHTESGRQADFEVMLLPIEPMPDGIRVSLTGERQKFIAGKQVPPTFTRYSITFVTRPRNRINQYGLVATKIEVENVPY